VNILILCTKPPWPPRDGGALAMLNMIKSFYRLGHEVTVIMMNTAKHYTYLRDLPESVQRMAEFYAVDVDTKIRYWDVFANLVFSKEPYHVQRFTSGPFRQQLYQVLNRNKFDVIQLETLYMTPYLETIRENSPESLIAFRPHNMEHEIWQRRAANEGNPIKEYMFKEMADRISDYELGMLAGGDYDVLVPITGKDAGMMRKLGASRPLHVCPAGFDVEEMMPQLDEEEEEVEMEYPSVAYLGAMDWEPNREGIDWFLKEVWPIVYASFPDVKFYLAGRNMPGKYFGNRMPGVEVVGEVPDAARFIESKAVIIAPILSGSGMRIKVIEGMAHGRAIVATSIAAEGIGVTDTSNIFLADDPATFAARIKILLEQRPLYDTIAAKAQEYIRKDFDNDGLVKKLVGFYKKQLKGRK